MSHLLVPMAPTDSLPSQGFPSIAGEGKRTSKWGCDRFQRLKIRQNQS